MQPGLNTSADPQTCAKEVNKNKNKKKKKNNKKNNNKTRGNGYFLALNIKIISVLIKKLTLQKNLISVGQC